MTTPGYDVPGDPLPESRFIPADERCPHPERWTSTDGDSTECEVAELIGALVVALQPDLVVETGAAFGQTTLRIAEALSRREGARLISLEVDEERAQATRSLVEQFETTEVIECSSLEWTPPGQIDLLFSDTFYEHRIPEFDHFRPWLRAGSVVVFHDTAPGRGSHRMEIPLRDQIDDLARRGSFNVIHLPTPRGVSIAEVLA